MYIMENCLTMQGYFDLINSHKIIYETQNIYESYVPNVLYKYFPIPDDETKKDQRFQQLENEQIWLSRKVILNDPFEMEHCILHSASSEAQKYYRDKTQELEFFCMTSSPLNKLMWSHYADSYKGFCVAFSVGSPGWIYPVIYDNILPDLSEAYQRFYENREKIFFLV